MSSRVRKKKKKSFFSVDVRRAFLSSYLWVYDRERVVCKWNGIHDIMFFFLRIQFLTYYEMSRNRFQGVEPILRYEK